MPSVPAIIPIDALRGWARAHRTSTLGRRTLHRLLGVERRRSTTGAAVHRRAGVARPGSHPHERSCRCDQVEGWAEADGAGRPTARRSCTRLSTVTCGGSRLDGSGAERLTAHGPDRAAQAPVASPDGRHVVYVVDQSEVWSVQLATAAREPAGPSASTTVRPTSASIPTIDPASASVGLAGMERAGHAVGSIAARAGVTRSTRRSERSTDAITHAVGASVQQPRFAARRHARLRARRHRMAERLARRGAARRRAVRARRADVGTGSAVVRDPPVGRAHRLHAQRGGLRPPVRRRRRDGSRRHARARRARSVVVGRDPMARAGSPPSEPVRGRRPRSSCIELDETVDHGCRRARSTIGSRPTPSGTAIAAGRARAVAVAVDDGEVVHARLLRADTPRATLRRVLICWLHGGPTDQWQVTFMPRLAYWRARDGTSSCPTTAVPPVTVARTNRH